MQRVEKKEIKEYLLNVLIKMGVDVDEEYIYIPDELTYSIIDAKIPHEVYEYFEAIYSSERKVIDITKIVGSHDIRNITNGNWFNDFISNPSKKENLEKYLVEPESLFNSQDELPKVFLKDGKYYLADGHHRIECALVDYYIKKSKGLSTSNIPLNIEVIQRVVPNDIEFVRRILSFLLINHIYKEDDFDNYIYPLVEVIDSNPDNPILRYLDTDILITKDSDLDEVLAKITEYKKKEESINVSK